MADHPADAITVDRLTCGWGRRTVLRNLTLHVPQGSVCALLGRNGEGKTTLVRCLLGQLRPLRGRVSLLGSDPWRHRARLMDRVGVVPETPDLPVDRRIGEILTHCARLHSRWNAAGAAARLERFGLDPALRVDRLSRGQATQVQLTIALATSPRLLVLDDPTLGLDALARRELQEELVGELAEGGTTVFLTSHDLEGVERLADRVAILVDGRVAEEGPLEELKQRWRGEADPPASLEEIFVAVVQKEKRK